MKDRGHYEETRTAYSDLGGGVQLKVDAFIRGHHSPGDEDSPPEYAEEVEVVAVTLMAFGRLVDLLPDYTVGADPDLLLAVSDALDKI